MADEMSKREAIDKTARDHVDAMRKQGVNLDYHKIRDRIATAVERGDRKREDNK